MGIGIRYSNDNSGLTLDFNAPDVASATEHLRSALGSTADIMRTLTAHLRGRGGGGRLGNDMSNEQYHALKAARMARAEAKQKLREMQKDGRLDKNMSHAERMRRLKELASPSKSGMVRMDAQDEMEYLGDKLAKGKSLTISGFDDPGKLKLVGDKANPRNGEIYSQANGMRGWWTLDDLDKRETGGEVGDGGKDINSGVPFSVDGLRSVSIRDGKLYAKRQQRKMSAAGRVIAVDDAVEEEVGEVGGKGGKPDIEIEGGGGADIKVEKEQTTAKDANGEEMTKTVFKIGVYYL